MLVRRVVAESREMLREVGIGVVLSCRTEMDLSKRTVSKNLGEGGGGGALWLLSFVLPRNRQHKSKPTKAPVSNTSLKDACRSFETLLFPLKETPPNIPDVLVSP